METQRISITLEEYLELINDRERLFYFKDSGELSVNGGMKSADKDIGLTKMSDLKKDKRIEVNKPITPKIPNNWKSSIEKVEYDKIVKQNELLSKELERYKLEYSKLYKEKTFLEELISADLSVGDDK